VRFSRTSLLAGVALAALATGMIPGDRMIAPQVAQAQNLGQRGVAGRVIDANSASVSGATVFLKNLKTKAIRSFTSTASGKFRFAQVNMPDDYDLWAQKDDKKSAIKTVSSWDTRKEFDCELKLK
jgi:hypothetical protein